jgi:hypothetical protein
VDEQHRRDNLQRARLLILSAEARLRYYAYVEEAPDDALTQAIGDWMRAEELLWGTVRERAQVRDSMTAFTEAASALALLMDTLTAGMEAPKGPAGDSPAPMPP